MKKYVYCLSFLFVCSLALAKEFNIYVDADFSVHKESAEAIYNAVSLVAEEQSLKLGHQFVVKKLDHRGNTRRSLRNFEIARKDPKTIAVFGGLHSPPLITNNEFINKNRILTLVPWAAGGPITRSKSENNYIFRLSVDDAQAGGFIANYAVKNNSCKKPYLFLEDTPWGKSNEKNMTAGFKKNSLKVKGISKYRWGVSKSSASELTSKVLSSGADCLFFVGNGKDAKVIFSSFGDAGLKIPIFSHWGITGGNNREMAKLIFKNKLKVKVIQTSFSFLFKKKNKVQKSYQKKIQEKYQLTEPREILPMAGWVHGIDLTNLFFVALGKADLGKEPRDIQSQVKKILETETLSYSGLIKNYKKPFSEYKKSKPNSHEALRGSDFIMLEFDSYGSLR